MSKPLGGSSHANARDALDTYKRARLAFVTSLNEMLRKDDPSLDAALLDNDCLALLHRPLVQDTVPGVRVSALAAMRALATRVDRAGDVLATPETLSKIVSSLSHDDQNVVVAGCGLASALASKRESHVRSLFDAGALGPLRKALDSLNPEIMDAASRCAVAVVAASPWAAERFLAEETACSENEVLPGAALHSGTQNGSENRSKSSILECLCAATSSPTTSLCTRSVIVRIFNAICKHGEALAKRVVRDCDACGVAARLARDAATRVDAREATGPTLARARAAAFACLSTMAAHSADLAAVVMASGVTGDAVAACVYASDAYPEESFQVREAATFLLLSLVNKTPELAQAVCDAGAVESLVQNLSMEAGSKRSVPALTALGYIADYKPSLALRVVTADGGQRIVQTLAKADTGDVAATAAWALGCCARHGEDTASLLAQNGAIRVLLGCYVGAQADRHPTLRDKARTALTHVIKKCGSLDVIDFLVSPTTPGPVLKHVLSEFAERLGKDVHAKRAFVTSGGLMRLQNVCRAHEKDVASASAAARKGESESGEKVTSAASAAIGELAPLLDERSLRDAKKINAVFPPDVVVSCSGEDHADHAVAATESPLAWTRRAGDVFGPGDWFLVEQPLVDAFAQCTRDDQWIHRAGADTPFGGPIAHGFLTLSLLPVLCKHVMPTHAWATSEINCGFNKMRFLSPVKVGARVRATVLVTAAELLDSKNPSAGTQTTSKVTIEIEGTTKPALVAEWVTRQYGCLER